MARRRTTNISEICKAIRQKIKENIRKHDEKQIIGAIENSKVWNKQDRSSAYGKVN